MTEAKENQGEKMIAFKPKSWSEKILVAVWLLVPVAMIGPLLFNWKNGISLDALLLGFVWASIPTTLAVSMIAFIENGEAVKISKYIWIAVAAMSVLAQLPFLHKPDGDMYVTLASQIVLFPLLVISFPLNLLVVFFFPYPYCGLRVLPNYTYLLEALILFGLGYTQWFVFLPWRHRKWKARQSAK